MKKKLPSSVGDWLAPGEMLEYKATVKPYTIKDLCVIYEASYKCMKAMLHRIYRQVGKKRGKYYSVRQVDRIFGHYGVPNRIVGREERAGVKEGW